MGYVTGGGSTGSGGAPSGAASGELAGTYPGPTVADGVIDDANIVAGGLTNAALATAAAIANTKLATNPLARANHTGTQAMATISDAGTLATKSAIASADITDGTIVSADLSGSAGITSAQLAGSIAPSKITGTAVTAADTGTVTSTMLLDATILNADVNASAAIAVSKFAAGSQSDRLATINSVPTWTKPQGYYLRPTGAIAESVPRATVSGTSLLTSGTILMIGMELDAGTVVGNFNFRTTSGTTMASGTHQWVILTDSSRVMVATTADPASATVPGPSATWTIAVANISGGASATYTVPTTGLYYVGVMITASPMPTFVASAVNLQTAAIAPILQGTADSAQTTVKAFPGGFTASSITQTGNAPYCWIT